MKTVEEIHQYWHTPSDGKNRPEDYLHGVQKSQLILRAINELKLTDPMIIELGCNVGRNLNALHNWNYTNLRGIELNPAAVELCHKHFPYLKGGITLGALEGVLPTLKKGSFDVVFTMAVLEHVHPDSCELVFDQMTRITKGCIITIEDEQLVTWRHFPRKYDEIFQSRGMRQIKEQSCDTVPGLGARFVLRVFKKGR